jgi:predicted ATPase
MREVQGFPLLESLKDFLQEKHVLLVLDNFEHVADAAPAVTDLLAAAPQLQVLATSRAVLQLYGESIYLVPPLLIPEDLTQCLLLNTWRHIQVCSYLLSERERRSHTSF